MLNSESKQQMASITACKDGKGGIKNECIYAAARTNIIAFSKTETNCSIVQGGCTNEGKTKTNKKEEIKNRIAGSMYDNGDGNVCGCTRYGKNRTDFGEIPNALLQGWEKMEKRC